VGGRGCRNPCAINMTRLGGVEKDMTKKMTHLLSYFGDFFFHPPFDVICQHDHSFLNLEPRTHERQREK
jgi:hypothetical protein